MNEERLNMTEIIKQIPAGERFVKSYQACEGDLRVITTDGRTEKRYTVDYSDAVHPILKEM